ncbi:sigma-70 family RNA polymerase sigma factor [Verrucomicrobiaceae bacterium N1E253]|uniref:Sigma-70 family RNA polymerase sigma factor n=1 Tax=Oceaniferula marina TaxID=2748318 RepID=A0A851GJ22_9BACT|nr:sigma-70 family RNA polymerase sigma factor [Oceaniferula marina]NWK57336.1 sigma-70 family RNA polymerase sigma factor [Oceaniferula marina]
MTEFVHLLTSHQEVIRGYITSLLPNYQDVNDVLQDVNVKLWERQHTFELGTNFGAWSCTMAKYIVLSHRAKLKRQNWLLFSDELIEKLADPVSATAEPVGLASKRVALHQCLKKLDSGELELLRVRYDEDVSVIDHAGKIGKSAESLRMMLYRIRLGLKDCVQRRLRMEGDMV